jgi:apolipoprotein N-acyltransferase
MDVEEQAATGAAGVAADRRAPTNAAGTPPQQGWHAARGLLHGALRTLVTGQCLGQAADGFAQIAFAQFVVFDAGRGATPERIAALLVVTLLPLSLVGPFAGVVIDRWPRRRVLVLMSLLRAALTVTAVVTVAARWRGGAYAEVLLLLSVSRFVLAAKGAALPRTVRPGELVTANAISSVTGSTATFVGAVAGAAFVGRSAAAGFVVATVLYLVAGGVFARLPDVGGRRAGSLARLLRGSLGDVVAGVRAIGHPEIGRPLGAVWLHRFLLGAGFVVLVLVADSRFHLRISGYGLALASTGVAAFAGSAAAPVCARRWPPTALLAIAFLPPAAAAYVAGTTPGLVVMVAALGVTGFSFQLLKVLVDALVGGASADQVRGRVFSIYDVVYNVAFVCAGLLMVPLWHPAEVRALLWGLAGAFLLGWLLFARLFHGWPFAAGHAIAARPGRRRGWLAALGCGALPVLAFPAVAWWWFAWVCLVPLLLVLRSAPTAREAALRGWWAGAGYLTAAAYWLAPVAGPALPLVTFGLALPWLPWGWAAWRLLAGRPRPGTLLAATLVLPAGWVAAEALRSWQSLGGPWALLGTSQWNQPATLASAGLGGVWLTGFLVVAANVALVGILLPSEGGTRALVALVAVVAAAVGPVWAVADPPQTSGGAALRVGVVQPGVMSSPRARLDREIRLSETLTASRPRLIAWGESSVGYDLQSHPRLVRRLQQVVRRTRADLLVNVDARQRGGAIQKTSVLVTAGGPDGRYEKTRLVPFGEYVPLRQVLGWITRISEAAAQDRVRGHGPVVLRSGSVRVGPLVCFESTFPDLARREVALGAQLLVYQTANSTFQGSWEQPQQAGLAAVRAVETARPVVQATLTGTTAAFDAGGRQRAWIAAGRDAATVVALPLTGGRTPYDVAGDWVLDLAAIVLTATLVVWSLTPGAAVEHGPVADRLSHGTGVPAGA